MNYCSHCGQPVSRQVPPGDSRERAVCTACGATHYENPRVVVGCIAEHQGRILLCRRAIEPRRGYWTAPAGFLELGESIHHGALRECREEALAEVQLGGLVAIVNCLKPGQVHMMFRGQLVRGAHGVGEESLETRLYDPADIPWQDMAFRSVVFALERYLEDRREGRERLHFCDLD